MRNTIKEILAKAENKRAKNNFSLPTPKEIDSEEILQLAKRLKGESEKETLTNILEWQDRNIGFWLERWIVSLSVLGIIIIGLSPAVAYVIAFYIGDKVALKVNLVILVATLKFIVILVIILIGYLFFLKFTLYKDMEWKAIYYTLPPNPPVNKILEYNLALCRDYTRLTASLLFNLYPDSEVCFIKTTWHETVGVKLKDEIDEIYVLDQNLPITTIDNEKYANADIFSAKRDSKGDIILKREPKPKRMRRTLAEINTEELTEEVAKIINVKQSSPKSKPDFSIRLEKYAEYYRDNEIIKYSLIRAIKNRFEDEFCGNIHKVSKVTINRDNEDLMLEVYYEGNNVYMQVVTSSISIAQL